jgi:hypothetical protein
MELTPEQTTSLVACENCQTNTPSVQTYCSQCSFPVNGMEEEKRNFRLLVSSRKRLVKDAEEKMKSSKVIIYIMAGIFFLVGLYMGFGLDDYFSLTANLVCCIIYLGLAAWTDHNPFGAILTALILYITLIVINAFIEPSTLFSGIIMKVIFISAFVKGIRSAQEAQRYLAELERLKAVPTSRG